MDPAESFRFEDLPEDVRHDFPEAPLPWRVRTLRSFGWPDERIKAFLRVDSLPARGSDPR